MLKKENFCYNISIDVNKVYKVLFILYCLFLSCRDILVLFDYSVTIYLALLFVIPLFIILFDYLNKPKVNFDLFLFIVISLFYVLISVYNINGIKLFMPMVYAGIAFRNMNLKYISVVFCVFQLLTLIIRYFLVDYGLVYENEINAFWKTDDGRYAHDLAYGNSNIAGMTFFFLLCMFHLCMYKSNKIISFFVILFVGLLSFYYTVSRTAFVSTTLLLSTYFIPNRINVLFCNKYLLWSVPIIVISPLIMLNYLSSIPSLDQYLSNRIYYISYLFQFINTPTAVLTGFQIDENNNFAIDNVFSYLLVYGGIIAIVIFFWFYRSFVSNAKYMPFYIVSLIVVMVVSGLGEASWAAFGRIGASFFWIIFMNKYYCNHSYLKV